MQWAAARCKVQFADGAQNQRDACQQADSLMEASDGIRTRGALLFRIDEGPGNDHVAISLGDGKTIEARGEAYGVNTFSAASRDWTHVGAMPGLAGGGTVKHGEETLELDDLGRRSDGCSGVCSFTGSIRALPTGYSDCALKLRFVRFRPPSGWRLTGSWEGRQARNS